MIMRSTCCSALFATIAIVVSGCCVDDFGGHGIDCHDGGCGIEAECAQCDDSGCEACSGPGPIHALRGLVHGGGCGQLYWDEWISDPPYRCDPCDDHGHWVGPRCCPPSIFHSWRKLWGHRGQGCGCYACLKRPEFADGGEIIEGDVIYEGPVIDEVIEPGQANPPTTLRPTQTRQISAPKSIRKRQLQSREVYYERAGAAGH